MLTTILPRHSLAHLPTPLEPLSRLTAQLDGPELWIKRDDQTGLATGGNKARKLEFLVGHALAQDADLLITGGATQSNHARQTAAAAARSGLGCVLVLRGQEPLLAQGNLLLDRLLGARVVWTEEWPPVAAMERAAEEERAAGREPYVVPYGGSNPVGASGYVAAMEELLAQCSELGLHFDHIVLPSSSGGTQAGLVVGARARGYQRRILGISIEPPADVLKHNLAELAAATAGHLGLDLSFTSGSFVVDDNYLGKGYGHVGELEQQALRTLGRSEGILLDPVYTGRAFGGMLDLIHRGVFHAGERVLFWHTGGTAGLFACADRL